MKTRISTICILAALLFSGCAKEPVGPETPDAPDTPTVGRHLRLSGSAGNDNAATRASFTDNNDGKLTFAWDYTPDNATESNLKMAFTKDGSCLTTVDGKSVTDVKILPHTDTEKATDKHWAEFETIGTYNPEMTAGDYDGYTVHAVTPVNTANGSTASVGDDGTFTAILNMPTTFTQSGENSLEHLSDYMYMYAGSVLEGGTASLSFKHLAAYVRFKVYNRRGEAATLYGVKMMVVDADGYAVPASGVQATYNATGASFGYTPPESYATDIQVDITDGNIVTDGNILLYAPVFPVGTENPFQDKTLCFILVRQDSTDDATQGDYGYLTYELSGEDFKNATQSYDWIPGDLYTFHLYLDDVQTVPEVTVGKWNTPTEDYEENLEAE